MHSSCLAVSLFLSGMDNPEYFHMAGSTSVNGGSAFQPVRSSSPQYIGKKIRAGSLFCG